jgi:hypothetical protein
MDRTGKISFLMMASLEELLIKPLVKKLPGYVAGRIGLL